MGYAADHVITDGDQRHKVVHDTAQGQDPWASTMRTALLEMINATTHTTRPPALARVATLGLPANRGVMSNTNRGSE